MSASIEGHRRAIDVSTIIRDGTFYILDEFALREEMYAQVISAFLDGVEALASRDSRRALERAGLRKLHEHFPVARIRLLEDFVLKRLREDLYYWSFAVGHRLWRASSFSRLLIVGRITILSCREGIVILWSRRSHSRRNCDSLERHSSIFGC